MLRSRQVQHVGSNQQLDHAAVALNALFDALYYLETSTKDDRVHPAHARKAAARLKEYGYDFLYYENIDGGHAAAANLNERAMRQALEYTYLSQQLMD